jgi:hypothetical protein
MSQSVCQQCGAAVKGYICEYCGSLRQATLDRAAEKEALNELHNIIAAQTEDETKSKLLRNGFIPDAPDVLIESGIRSIALIDLHNTTETVSVGAAQRLRAITAKLRLMGESGQASDALREFEQILQQIAKDNQRLERMLITIALAAVLALTGGCVWLVSLLTG